MTLIELLIVLALLAAIGALALPTTLETLSRRRFESDVDALIGQLRLARTHARTTASAVEVLMERAHDETTRVVVETVDLRAMALGGENEPDAPGVADGRGAVGHDGAGSGARSRGAPDRSAGSERGSAAIDASWADATYELVIEIGPEAPTDDPAHDSSRSASTPGAADAGADASAPAPKSKDEIDIGVRRRLTLFVADGGAPFATRLVVRDANGRRAAIVVNPWTGLASLAGAATAAARSDDEDALAPPDDDAERAAAPSEGRPSGDAGRSTPGPSPAASPGTAR